MRIGIYGLGNVLMGDDGFGPFVIRHLQSAYEFPENVTVEDLGTPGLNLIPYLIDLDAVVFVDVVKSAGAPGELRVYHTDEILRHAPDPRMTPHDPGVKSALAALRMADIGPRTATIVGAIPARVEQGVGLTDALRAAIPKAAAAVLQELAILDALPDTRHFALTSASWFDRIA